MATYLELQSLFNDNDLRLRTRAATVIAASNLLAAGTPTANDRAFAALVAANPTAISQQVLMFVIASNKDATLSQIQGAADAALQTNVDAVIPSLVSALAGA